MSVLNEKPTYMRFSDLTIVSIWVTITLISAAIPQENTYIRTILTIPSLLFIPGYVLMSALFPKKDDIDGVIRLALSFGLSIVIILLMGLLLNFTFGIRLVPILVSLYAYTMVLVFFGENRREKLPEDSKLSITLCIITYDVIFQKLKSKNRVDFILTMIIMFMILLTTSVIYYTVTTPKVGERYTEFYILNSSGDTNNYPTNISINSSTTLMIGVVNHEYLPVNYTVKVILNKKLLTSEELSLGDSKTWEKNVTFSTKEEYPDMEFEFLLYKENNFKIPYRTLHLWTNVFVTDIK